MFEAAYKQLNKRQKQAVDAIDGPLLVIAGPGTGKTQLLSARVARILQQTDTLPSNILCLTFTENGAENMRQRLTRFIGQDAYKVTISTYHAFGGDLIRRYPEYFLATRLQEPVDELGRHQIVAGIVDKLSYRSPLKQTRHHLGDLISTISEVKRALLTPDDLRAIAKENRQFIEQASKAVAASFESFKTMPRSVDAAVAIFADCLAGLEGLVPKQPAHPRFGSLAQIAVSELEQAIDDAQTAGKTTPLTKWKNSWLAKDSDNRFIMAGSLENRRIEALAGVLEQYGQALEERGLYDFDDMIIRAIAALEQNPDLKYSLQEQYLYVLLDEFQDTNAAQLRLVQLLTDNPVHEGRPNVMAVGDDDQAIYAFQGAQYSNMLDFYKSYRDVTVMNLSDNYRSHRDVLVSAQNIAVQIDERLHLQFDGVSKELVAANTKLPANAHITRHDFLSELSQYDWIASRIKKLIDSGTNPNEIAVLAPKHKQLEPLVPHLNALGLPVRYEKRENILEAPVVRQLLTMSKLVLALHNRDETTADALWPEVLSYEFWQIPTKTIWQISWQVAENRADSLSWSKVLLDNPACRQPALLLLTLAHRVEQETCEAMLDYLIGSQPLQTLDDETPEVSSPLKNFYTSKQLQTSQPELFYDTLSHLSVLRARLRDHQAAAKRTLKLQDLLDFVDLYEQAGQRMINTNPHYQRSDAVQLMTVFKAKGLEFEHVFLPCCNNDTWGSSARGNSNKLTLPRNLAPIRHAGANDDERLRILYVALTRAKIGLHLTNFLQTLSGKQTKYLEYLQEQEQADGSRRALVLPPSMQTVLLSDHAAPLIEQLELDWRSPHLGFMASTKLKNLLEERLQKYKLSPTHLNTFTDLIYGGPEEFFFNTLLRFPQAPSVDGQYGNAIHETLEWLQQTADKDGKLPAKAAIHAHFSDRMRRKHLTSEQTELQIERGIHALDAYLAQRGHLFSGSAQAEHNFSPENIVMDDVRLAGKIDRLEIDKRAKTITVVDYKTGKAYAAWKSDAKLHKYRQQLYCYKLLVELAPSFAGYTVSGGRLEFVEPDHDGVVQALELNFKPADEEHVKKLLQAMWQRVMNLDFPDVSDYPPTLPGIKQFEKELIKNLD